MYQLVLRFARKLNLKPGKEGIMQISNNQAAIDTANEILTKFKKHGVPNEVIKTENDVKVIYNQIKSIESQALQHRVISPGDPKYKEVTEKIFGKKTGEVVDMTGKTIQKPENIMGGMEAVSARNDKIQNLAAQLAKMQKEKSAMYGKTDVVTDTVTKITTMEPVAAMKEANLVIGRKGKYKNLTKEQSQKILKDTDDWIFQRDPDDLYDYNKKRPFRDDPDVDPEDFAGGGIAGMLGEPTYADENHRVPYKDGTKFDPKRRAFMKIAAGLASIPIIGKFFKFAKPLAKTAKVADLTSVPIGNAAGMPAWFKPLVNKVIKEGEEIGSGAERVIVHKTKLPNSKTDVYVTQELDTGHVMVDIGQGKHGFADGHLGQPVSLEYRASEVIEPTINTKTKKVIHKGQKTKPEFNVEEAEFTGGHPENVKFEESTINKFGEHGSNFDEVEMFATGKVKKVKPTKKKLQTEWESGKAEADADAAADMADDFASGGRVPLKFGKMPESKDIDTGVTKLDIIPGAHESQKLRELLNKLREDRASGGRVPLKDAGFTGSEIYFQDKFDEFDWATRYNRLKPQEGFEQVWRDYKDSTKMKEGELGKIPPIPPSLLKSGLGFILKQLAGGKFKQGRRDILDFIVNPGKPTGLTNKLLYDKVKKKSDNLTMKILQEMSKYYTKHAEGGRVPMLFGGGVWKKIIQNLAKEKGVSPSFYLKVTNYKNLPSEVRNLMSKAEFAEMKAKRIEMFENLVEMAKTKKSFQKSIEEGKKGSPHAAPIFEHLEQSFKSPVPSGVTDKDILQGEYILKNLKTKDRKLNASGGLAGMLGE